MKKEIIYNKLIRDRIPEIIRADNAECEIETLDDEKYLVELVKKIAEEAKELNESPNDNNLVEELTDLQEIIDAILAAKKIKVSEFRKLQTNKRLKRGSFAKKLFLIKTIENK